MIHKPFRNLGPNGSILSVSQKQLLGGSSLRPYEAINEKKIDQGSPYKCFFQNTKKKLESNFLHKKFLTNIYKYQ